MSESALPPPLVLGDRAKASRPVPKPGIMDIHAYVPGKSKAEGFAEPVKLSANENPLGSSPKARSLLLIRSSKRAGSRASRSERCSISL